MSITPCSIQKHHASSSCLLSYLFSPLSLTAEPRNHQQVAQLRQQPVSHNTTGLPSLLLVMQLLLSPPNSHRSSSLGCCICCACRQPQWPVLESSLQSIWSRATTTTTLTYLFPLFASFNFVSHLLFFHLILLVFN